MLGLHDKNFRIINQGLGRAQVEWRGAIPDGCVPSRVLMCGSNSFWDHTRGEGWGEGIPSLPPDLRTLWGGILLHAIKPLHAWNCLALDYKVTRDPSSTPFSARWVQTVKNFNFFFCRNLLISGRLLCFCPNIDVLV